MKRIIVCLLSMALLLAGCGGQGGTTSQSPVQSQSDSSEPEQISRAGLDVPLRYYGENGLNGSGSIIEIPQIVGEDNQTVQSINAELKDRFEQLKDTYKNGDDSLWCEVLAWPTETERYLNAVVTFAEYPVYGTYGQVSSWVYDKVTGQQVSLEEAFAMAGTDEALLLQDFARWSTEQGREMVATGLDSLAFRMLPDGCPQFLAGVTLEAPDLGEYWISFHTWTQGEVAYTQAVPFDPAEITGEYPGGQLVCQRRWAEEHDDVSLCWEVESGGTWPTEYTFETLQFCGHADTELDEANERLRAVVEFQRQRYLECEKLTEDERRSSGASWGNVWVYPVVNGRYLNAVLVERENMYYRVDEEKPWNMVSSVAYDMDENRIITLEEALGSAWVDQGTLEWDIYEFVTEKQMGTYENLSSLAFCMLEDGTPMFIIGAIVRESDDSIPWTTFFTRTDGYVEWTDEHPVPLYMVDMSRQDDLACQRGMGQYDDICPISEEEAADVLREIVEVQDYLSRGMQMRTDGTTERINGEMCICIALGIGHEESFVGEIYYAVSEYYGVYRLDPLSGAWETVGFG